MVFSGLTAAWRRASVPTRRSPPLVKATTDGVVRPPSALGITTGSPPSMTATTLLVVPRSIPTALAMLLPYSLRLLISFRLTPPGGRWRREPLYPRTRPRNLILGTGRALALLARPQVAATAAETDDHLAEAEQERGHEHGQHQDGHLITLDLNPRRRDNQDYD